MGYEKEFIPQSPFLSWLGDHLDGWQFGEQGLLVAIDDAIGLDGRCVEIGAGDGTSLPLTIDRFYSAGRECLLYEMDEQSQSSLASIYPDATIQGAYGCDGEGGDLFVIDVDGLDSLFMRHVMRHIKPPVVMCEHMDRQFPVMCSYHAPLPQWALGLKTQGEFSIQDTADTLHHYAASLGYERIGHNRCNSFFVRRDFYHLLFR